VAQRGPILVPSWAVGRASITSFWLIAVTRAYPTPFAPKWLKSSSTHTRVNKPPLEPLIRCFIGDSSPCVCLLGVSSTRLDNASLQEASYLKERRVKIVVRLLAESLVVVLVMALGWWGMTTLGSDSLQQMSEPIYVAGCPLSDTLEKGSAGGGCSKAGSTHPISSRQPGVGPAKHAQLAKHAHGPER
jgi:hypothetical protein